MSKYLCSQLGKRSFPLKVLSNFEGSWWGSGATPHGLNVIILFLKFE